MRAASSCIRVLIAVVVACGSGREPSAPAGSVESTSREVVNLRAFARLYGVVRWFHPSDEAAEVDWNAYALRGVAVVRGASDRDALATALDHLVTSVGAGIVIGTADEVARAPALPTGGDLVAWQHAGPGFDGGAGPYQSKRTSRPGFLRPAGDWGAFAQTVDATPYRGQRVRVRAAMAAGKRSHVGAWLRVDRAGGAAGFFDNMRDRAVPPAAWQRAAIEGDVAADAERIAVGGIVWGDEGWFDDFVLEVSAGNGPWTPVTLADADFERGIAAWSAGIGKTSPRTGDRFSLAHAPRGNGTGAAAHLRAPRAPLVVDPFEERPAAGEAVTVELGDGLVARVPIALASVDGQTLPAARPHTFASMIGGAAVEASEGTTAIADVIVAWNVFAHFYPYLDVIRTDWHAYLDEALADAIAGREALRRLVVAAEDGHGFIRTDPRRAYLPVVLEQVEGQIVVVVSAHAALQAGDEIVELDGVAGARAFERELARHSGSPQWRTLHALRAMGSGPDGSAAAVELRRAGVPVSAVVPRGMPPPRVSYPPIGELEPGIWLVDLSRAEVADLDARMDALANAKGVVFDLRGYPNGTHGVLGHLLDAPEQDRWMHVAHVIRPNLPGQPPPAHTWDSVGWNLTPVAPRFRGKVVFMTGPGAISYAESVMGYVEALGLPIVGAATAGTNGNIREVTLPSGAAFSFTGMKVTRHDGSRFHLEGVRPTVPVDRTLAGVIAGKDEILERALTLIR